MNIKSLLNPGRPVEETAHCGRLCCNLPDRTATFFWKRRGVQEMAKRFRVGDHVSWNSEAGRVSGTIIAVHTHDFDYKGYVHHASDDDPQYEIKSDKSDHIAAHKGRVLDRA
jgi:hypothetical protein